LLKFRNLSFSFSGSRFLPFFPLNNGWLFSPVFFYYVTAERCVQCHFQFRPPLDSLPFLSRITPGGAYPDITLTTLPRARTLSIGLTAHSPTSRFFSKIPRHCFDSPTTPLFSYNLSVHRLGSLSLHVGLFIVVLL